MGRQLIYTIFALATLSLVSSCSIKEDRSGCPCELTIDASGINAEEVSVICRTDMDLFRGRLHPGGDDRSVEIKVPRDIVQIVSYTGNAITYEDDNCLIIPYGNESDCIYADVSVINTKAETAYKKVSLHKQYARISLEFINDTDNEGGADSRLSVIGSANGISLSDLSPVSGAFHCMVTPGTEGVYSFNVPRQKDNGLYVLIENGGHVSDPVQLGKILESVGFDWTKKDLDDISLKIELPSSVISVSITEWDKVDTEVVL